MVQARDTVIIKH